MSVAFHWRTAEQSHFVAQSAKIKKDVAKKSRMRKVNYTNFPRRTTVIFGRGAEL